MALTSTFDGVVKRGSRGLVAFAATLGLTLTGLTLGVPSAQAAPDLGLPSANDPQPVGDEPVTESTLDFVETTVDPDYVESAPVSAAEGERQQVEAVLDDEDPEGDDLDVHIARVDLDTDVALVAATWDVSAVSPEAVYLRYLETDTWSSWVEVETEEAPEGHEDQADRAGTEPFMLTNASAVEVVAREPGGRSLPGLELTVIDARALDPVDNALEGLETEEEDERSNDEMVDPQPLDTPSETSTEQEDSTTGGGSEPAVAEEPVIVDEPAVGDDPADETTEEGDSDVLLDLDGAVQGEGVAAPGTPALSSSIPGIVPAKLNAAGTIYDTGFQGLKINTRKAWGANESWMKWKREPITIRGAVVHHTAGNNNYTKAQVPAQIRIVYQYHARTLGWGDIGYNLVVDKYGGVWEGRAGGLTRATKGAQAYGANSETFGISVFGDYMKTAPPKVARQNMAKAIAWKLDLHGIKSATAKISVPGEANLSAGRTGKIQVPTVSAHRDVGWTSCPGNAFYNQMATVRKEVGNYLAAANTPVKPAASSFTAGNVISDKVFYTPNTMTVSQIQTFLNTAGKSCTPGKNTTCLKSAKFPAQNLETLRGGCKPFNLTGNQSAAKIIHTAAQACGLNPQVILTTLQKEQSGLTQPKTAATWAKAMGSGCPDGSGCDAAQGGFAKQVYYGADKLVSYKLKSMAGHVNAFNAGKTMKINHNAAAKCGTRNVKFANVATASLYEYTPYIGNSSVKGCGATGQKNFYDIMKRYFPNAEADAKKATTTPAPKPVTYPASRIGGKTRYIASANVAKSIPSKGKPAFLVSGQKYTDALMAAPAAAVTGGTVYTVSKSGMSAEVAAALKAQKPSKLYIVGGTSPVPTVVANRAQSLTGKKPVRFSGATPAIRSGKVYNHFFKGRKFSHVIVAGRVNYGDAVSASAAAVATKSPLLFAATKGSNPLPTAALNNARAKGVRQAVVIARKNKARHATVNQIKARGLSLVRINGTNTYQTNRLVNNWLDKQPSVPKPKTVWIGRGARFPEGMLTPAAAGRTDGRVILAKKSCVTVNSRAKVNAWKKGGASVKVVGNSAVLSTNVRSLGKC